MESNPVLALDSEVCKDSLGTFVWSIPRITMTQKLSQKEHSVTL